jgi:hypothetical protein
MEHSILVAIFYMLQRDQPYHDLGVDYVIRATTPNDAPANSSDTSRASATPCRQNHHRRPPHSRTTDPRGPVVFSSGRPGDLGALRPGQPPGRGQIRQQRDRRVTSRPANQQ